MSNRWADADRRSRVATRVLESPALGHDAAVVALAVVLGGADPEGLWDRLDDAARPMFGLPDGQLHEQATALADVITNRLGLYCTTTGHRGLLLNHALTDRAADPMLLATIGHELARHAGLSSLVAYGSGHYWTLLTHQSTFLPIGYDATPGRLEAGHLRACCAHEVSHRALVQIAARAPDDCARQADQLCLALTFACRATTPACRGGR